MKFPLGNVPANRRVDPHVVVSLLREMPDMTLADVGRRVGLSKERIRQIAGDIPGASRHNKKRVCSVCGVRLKDGERGYNKGYCPDHWKEVLAHNKELHRRLHWSEFTCVRCGGKFSRRLAEVNRANKRGWRIRFCSRACYNDYDLRGRRCVVNKPINFHEFAGCRLDPSVSCDYGIACLACPRGVKLHLGCGDIRILGFVGVDTRNLSSVDIIASADKLDMFGDNSVDLIYASHILEHFGRNDTDRVLREWHRVLKLGGILRLAVPDFEKVAEVYLKTKDLKLLLGHLVGGQDYPENLHRMVFDFGLLSELLTKVGFANIRRYDWRQTIHKDYDDYSQAYWPHLDKEHGTLMSLNVEAEK